MSRSGNVRSGSAHSGRTSPDPPIQLPLARPRCNVCSYTGNVDRSQLSPVTLHLCRAFAIRRLATVTRSDWERTPDLILHIVPSDRGKPIIWCIEPLVKRVRDIRSLAAAVKLIFDEGDVRTMSTGSFPVYVHPCQGRVQTEFQPLAGGEGGDLAEVWPTRSRRERSPARRRCFCERCTIRDPERERLLLCGGWDTDNARTIDPRTASVNRKSG